MKNKKQIICLLLFIPLLLSACSFGGWTLKIKDAADIAEKYYEYEELFQNAAEALVLYTDITMLITTSDHAEEDEWRHYTVGEFDISVPQSQCLSAEDCEKIHDALAPLFEACGLEVVTRQDMYVDFLLEKRAGRCADLFYVPTGERVRPGFDVVDDLNINECWYAATSSD